MSHQTHEHCFQIVKRIASRATDFTTRFFFCFGRFPLFQRFGGRIRVFAHSCLLDADFFRVFFCFILSRCQRQSVSFVIGIGRLAIARVFCH